METEHKQVKTESNQNMGPESKQLETDTKLVIINHSGTQFLYFIFYILYFIFYILYFIFYILYFIFYILYIYIYVIIKQY